MHADLTARKMSSFRNIDLAPNTSVKQGTRIVHPVFARIARRDPDVASQAVSQTPTNAIRFQDSNKKGENKSRKEEGKHSAPVPLTQGKDNITETNKNSSNDQKRFYQRKLNGLSQIRLFPVGKLFKFLRPPLQRRNSCPVISISELEAEAQFQQSKLRNVDVANQVTQHSTDEQRSNRLSKWTSQEQLQQQRKEAWSENLKSIEQSSDNKSFPVPAVSDQENDFNSSVCTSEEYEECELRNGEPYSPLFQKTVIIVSESLTMTSNTICDSSDSSQSSQSEKININGISISMISRACVSENISKQISRPSPITLLNNSVQNSKENNVEEYSMQEITNHNSNQIPQIPQVKKGETNCQIHSIHGDNNFDSQELLEQNNAPENTTFMTNQDCVQASEIISIAPQKVNNVHSTLGSVIPSFSTFKGDFRTDPLLPNPTAKFKINKISEISSPRIKSSSPSSYFDNFTFTSFNNQQNNMKAQNISCRQIYVPDYNANDLYSDIGKYDSYIDDNDIVPSMYDENIEKASEKQVDVGIKSFNAIASTNRNELITNSNLTDAEKKIAPRAQLISITCTKTSSNTKFSNQSSVNNNPKISSRVNSDPDSLNFGENRPNVSLIDIQSADINECYNVKLDAPEDFIVAGFHDFCHTMLSLEESMELNGTGTVKRRKIKSEIVTPKVENNRKMEDISNRFIDGQRFVSSEIEGKSNSSTDNPNAAFIDKNPKENATSNNLLEDLPVNKSLEKMNIKDADVIEAINALDESLKEVSDHPIFDGNDVSETASKISIPEIKSSKLDKKPSNVPKEDKIQCDNLIEEVLLEDASKRILHSYKRPAPPPPPKRDSYSQSRNALVNNLQKHQSYSSELKEHNLLAKETEKNVNSNDNNKNSFKFCNGKINKTVNNSEKNSINGLLDLPSSLSVGEAATDNCSNPVVQDIVRCNRSSPCSVDSGTSSHNQGFFVVIAIDFGTTYSGYAFSLTRDPDNIYMMKKWDGGDPGVCNQKSPTTILLSPDRKFHSFGFSARDFYHDLETEEARKWLYFEKFKMTLHNTEHLSLETEIAAANSKKMPALTIFAHALRYFKEHALQELSDHSATTIVNEDVRWVVTVPAIWKQPAKQFMRAAAYQAGIASPEYPEQLLIALEPEAASIYCRKMKLHQLVPEEEHYQRSFHWCKDRDAQLDGNSVISEKDRNLSVGNFPDEGSFSVGTQYMVVDCGGGTVDITVHELLDKQGALKELQTSSGGPYGSIGVDLEFENFLCEIFGNDFMHQFKSTRPAGYIDLMTAFEARKRNASPYKNNSLNISLPFSFIEYYKKYKGQSVESTVKKFSHKNIKWSQGMLRLEPSTMEGLFQKTIKHIRKQIEDIINQKELRIEYIFLVGGFAESLILQKEMKEAFSARLKVVIPQGVSLAILKGAVLFGLDPTTVNIRRLRMTYGVGVLNQFIHGVHSTDKLVIKNGKQWCADVYDKFAVTNQSVGTGDVVIRRYTPAKEGQSCSVIHIYCSETDNAYFITDPGVKRCATLILDLSESRYIQSREIQTRMMFGDTEIKVSALDVTTGKCVKAEIDFLNQ